MPADKIDQNSVYLTADAPLPKDKNIMLSLLFNDPFQKVVNNLYGMYSSKGYALADVLKELSERIIRLNFPKNILAGLLDGMSNIKDRFFFDTEERLQTGYLVGVFNKARLDMIPVAVD